MKMLGNKKVFAGAVTAVVTFGCYAPVVCGGEKSSRFSCAERSLQTLNWRPELPKREEVQGLKVVMPRANRLAACIAGQQSKAETKHQQTRVVRVGYGRDLSGSMQRALRAKNAARDAEILPALIGELRPLVYAAFKNVHRAMQQRLQSQRSTRAERDKKLKLFQEALYAFVANKSALNNDGVVRRLFEIAADNYSRDFAVNRALRTFFKKSLHCKSDEARQALLLNMIAAHVQLSSLILPQAGAGRIGRDVDALIAQFQDFTLGQADAQDEMDEQELYDVLPDSRSFFEADVVVAAEYEDESGVQALYDAYLDSLSDREEEVAAAEEAAAEEEEEEEEEDMTSKEVAAGLYGRRGQW